MSIKSRLIMVLVLIVALLLLSGCAGAFIGLDVASIDSTSVTLPMQYLQGSEEGPVYNVSVDVPGDWVGNFRTRNVGNVVYFEYTGDDSSPSLIFTIDALSSEQYWKQSGSYPGSYKNIVNRGDTYFIYNLPIDTYYSNLPDAQFESLAQAVPQVVASFQANPAQ